MQKCSEPVLELIRGEWSELHHTEEQRSRLTNMLLVIQSACVVVVVEFEYRRGVLPVCGVLVLSGLLGAVSAVKYYERAKYAQSRLTELFRQLDRIHPEAQVLNILRAANMKHRGDPDVLLMGSYHIQRLPLHLIWLTLHFMFVGLGTLLFVLVLVH